MTASDARVVDGVKAIALLTVVAGHSLAWTATSRFSFAATLDSAPEVWWVTWLVQVLPLFFLLSATGLRRLAESRDGRALANRVSMLIVPAFPLYLLAAMLSVAVGMVRPDLAVIAGFLPVQLTWFIGVSVLIAASAPLLVRVTHWGMVGWIAAIAVADYLRFHLSPGFGWVNMFLVWAAFTIVGLRLPQVLAMQRWAIAAALVASVAAASALITLGPYSRALISSQQIPGESNLAPPTLVLLCFGLAQACVVVLAWPLLVRLIAMPRIARVVDSLSVRAMQVYLYHLLVVSVLALVVSQLWLPTLLSAGWWAVHLAVFATAVTVVMVAAAPLRAASVASGAVLAWPWRNRVVLGKRSSTVAGLTTGLVVLVIAGVGVGRLSEASELLGMSFPRYLPLVALAALAGILSAAGRSIARQGTAS